MSENQLRQLQGGVSALCAKCDALVVQASQAPQRAEMNQRLEAAQAQYDAAERDGEDFNLIAFLLRGLEALQLESAQLPLSEEGYLTLPTRHASLVHRVTDSCKAFMGGKDYESLATIGSKLTVLRALDVSTSHTTGKLHKKSISNDSLRL
jgi:hypothetical protein